MNVFNTVVDGLTKASNSLPTILGNLGKAIGAFFEGIGPGLLSFGEMMATPTAFFGIPAGAIVLAMMMGVAAALNIAAPAIEKLTPLEEDIFVEYGFNSSYKEISNSLNVPPKCVDNALTRIRKKASEVYVQYSMQETILIRQKSEEKPEPSPEEWLQIYLQ